MIDYLIGALPLVIITGAALVGLYVYKSTSSFADTMHTVAAMLAGIGICAGFGVFLSLFPLMMLDIDPGGARAIRLMIGGGMTGGFVGIVLGWVLR